jgi:hypothetical protein
VSKEIEEFNKECAEEILIQGNNHDLKQKSIEWLNEANNHKYSYHFKWMNRPIIQYPQDIQMMQELIMEVKPDLIIETDRQNIPRLQTHRFDIKNLTATKHIRSAKISTKQPLLLSARNPYRVENPIDGLYCCNCPVSCQQIICSL